jgi:hypothetical protein
MTGPQKYKRSDLDGVSGVTMRYDPGPPPFFRLPLDISIKVQESRKR